MPFLPHWKIRSFHLISLLFISILAVAALAACGSEAEPAGPSADASTSSSSVPESDVIAPAEPAVVDPLPLATPAGAKSTMPSGPTLSPEPTSTVLATPIVQVEPTQAPREVPTDPPEVAAVEESDRSVAPDEVLAQPDATWSDVFNTFSEEEQSCIRGEMGDERLDSILDQPFALEGLEEEPVAVLDCISDEVAREILLADFAAQNGGLTGEQELCLRGLLGNISPVELAKAMSPDSQSEPTQEQALLMLSFGFGMVTCIPEFGSGGPGAMPGSEGPIGGPTIRDESLLWSYTTGGWVVTAPAVVDGVVYVGSDDYSVYALNAASGELLWSHATGDVIRSTPTVVDGRVFVGSNDNHVYALDAATGELLWRFDTGGWAQYSPQVGNGNVYLAVQGNTGQKVVALDAATGETEWTADVAARIDPTYTPTVSGNQLYVAGAVYGDFYVLDAANGEEVWQAGVSSYVESAPTVLDGIVYLTVVNQAYALDDNTGEVIWSLNTDEYPARDFPALVVNGVYYLAPSDKVYALDAATGAQLWTYESQMLSTAPAVAGGVFYGASEETGLLFALDAATGAEIWTEPTEGAAIHSIAVIDNTLYVESDMVPLLAVDLQARASFKEFQKGGFSDIRGYTVKDGVLYFGSFDNRMDAYTAP